MSVRLGKYLPISITFFLAACGGFPTTHPDPVKNNPATYKTDVRDCAQSYPETADGSFLKRRITCLQLKGWQ